MKKFHFEIFFFTRERSNSLGFPNRLRPASCFQRLFLPRGAFGICLSFFSRTVQIWHSRTHKMQQSFSHTPLPSTRVGSQWESASVCVCVYACRNHGRVKTEVLKQMASWPYFLAKTKIMIPFLLSTRTLSLSHTLTHSLTHTHTHTLSLSHTHFHTLQYDRQLFEAG